MLLKSLRISFSFLFLFRRVFCSQYATARARTHAGERPNMHRFKNDEVAESGKKKSKQLRNNKTKSFFPDRIFRQDVAMIKTSCEHKQTEAWTERRVNRQTREQTEGQKTNRLTGWKKKLANKKSLRKMEEKGNLLINVRGSRIKGKAAPTPPLSKAGGGGGNYWF